MIPWIPPSSASPSVPSPTEPYPMTPSLAVMWSREAGLYLSMREPGYFPLFPIAETDPRFHALTQRVYIIDVAQAPLVLWGPLCLDEERLHYRGLVAVALDATTICDDGDPDLWVVHRPYQFLRADAIEYRTWLLALAAHRDVWFSCDGASLVRLLEAAVNAAGELMIDVEQLVG
jgi:hypothetical protein